MGKFTNGNNFIPLNINSLSFNLASHKIRHRILEEIILIRLTNGNKLSFPPSSRVNQTWNFRRNKNLINVNNLFPLVNYFCIFPQAAIQIRHQVLEENVWIPSMRNMCGVGHSESTTRIVSFVKDSCKKQQNSKCELCTNKKVGVQFGIKIVKAFWQLTATTVTGSREYVKNSSYS